MRVLVTGGSGFIGSHLLDDLEREGVATLNLDIRAPRVAAHTPHWLRQDILDAGGVAAAFSGFRPTHVVHLAARTDTDGRSLAEYEANTVGTSNVLRAIEMTSSVERTVITSTQFVHQGRGQPADDLDFAPHTVYGESKAISERLTRESAVPGTWTIIRPTNVWGPRHPRYAQEFWRVLRSGLYVHPKGPPVIRSYGYVRNVTWQIRRILDCAQADVHQQVLYVGDAPIDLLVWVNAFSRRLRGTDVRTVPIGAMRVLAAVGDLLARIGVTFPLTRSRLASMTSSNPAPMERTLSLLGTPPVSLEAGVEESVQWLLSTGSGAPIA